MSDFLARQSVINEEYDNFIGDMEQNKTFCKYFDTWDYEDDFSHNDIDYMRNEFEGKIREWLIKNKPNQYYILGGFDDLIIMTEEELIKRNLNPSRYEKLRQVD